MRGGGGGAGWCSICWAACNKYYGIGRVVEKTRVRENSKSKVILSLMRLECK